MRQLLLLGISFLLSFSACSQSSDGLANRLLSQLQTSKADTNQVRLFLTLANYYQTDYKNKSSTYIDSSLLYARQAVVLSRSLGYRPLIGESLLTLSEALLDSRARETAQVKEARFALNQALQLYKVANDPLHYADATFLVGMSYSSRDTIRLPYLQSALTTYRKIGNKKQIAHTLTEIAKTNHLNGRLHEALKTYLLALSIQELIPDKNLEETIYLLSGLYKELGNYPKALELGYRGLKLAKRVGNISMFSDPYSSLATTFERLGNKQKALDYRYLQLQVASSQSNAQAIVRTRLGISKLLLALGKNRAALNQAEAAWKLAEKSVHGFESLALLTFGNCYLALNDFKNAELYYHKALFMALRMTGTIYSPLGSDCYKALGTLYLKMNRLAEAASCLNQALLITKKSDDPARKKDVVLLLYQLDSTRGKWQSALSHYRHYIALNNLLFNEVANKQVTNLQIQYDTEKKQQEIIILQQQNVLKQASIDRAQLTRNITIGGAAILALLLGLLYSRFRLKQRSHQQLQMQQQEIALKNNSLQHLVDEKEWLLKEIHHRVKNNLQIITSLLDSQAIFLEDRAALSAIRDSKDRIQSLALIHQKLYQSERLSVIPMAEYINEIVDYLIESYDRQDTIQKQISVVPLELDVTQAVPLGLILNEVVTNSLKYAFPYNATGEIGIELHQLEGQLYQLVMYDNGIGLSSDFDPDQSRSLGMSLIKGLSAQLEGNLQIIQHEGLKFILYFSLDKLENELGGNK